MHCRVRFADSLSSRRAPHGSCRQTRFANVFVETQPVQIAIAAGEAMPVQLRDLDGAEVARRDAAADAATLDFGTLPPGYYEAVAGDVVLPLVVLIDPAKRVRGESRLAMDNAMSWLVEADQWEPMARLLQQCGITLRARTAVVERSGAGARPVRLGALRPHGHDSARARH